MAIDMFKKYFLYLLLPVLLLLICLFLFRHDARIEPSVTTHQGIKELGSETDEQVRPNNNANIISLSKKKDRSPNVNKVSAEPVRDNSPTTKDAQRVVNLRHVASYESPSSHYGNAVRVKGCHAYMPMGLLRNLHIFDVSDPTNPKLLSTYNGENSVINIEVHGSYVYMTKTDGIYIVDVSDPKKPKAAGYYASNDSFDQICAAGSYLFLGTRQSIDILDISSPTNPTSVAYCDTFGAPKSINVEDASLYVVVNYLPCEDGGQLSGDRVYNPGVQILDISSPHQPEPLSHIAIPGALSVAAEGSHAYIAADDAGMIVLDVSQPESPKISGSWKTVGSASNVFVTSHYVFITDTEEGLQVVDISNPAQPRRVGSCRTIGEPGYVYVNGSYAYLGTTGKGLEIIKIFDSK